MKTESFRDILREFLEEETLSSVNAHASASSTSTKISEPTFTFQWQAPASKVARKANAYRSVKSAGATNHSAPSTAAAQSQPPPAPPAPLEPSWDLAALTPDERAFVQTFVQAGATGLSGRISLTLVKKAHRRLVKGLHPDALNGMNEKEKASRQEQFLKLQRAYERLSQALLKRANASADGSESASASMSPRPNAA